MKFTLENLKNSSIYLKRNREEEIRRNYTKIYDLSKLNKFENISFEEKKNLLITIKKILLSTNDYILSSNTLEILKYFLVSITIFILFIIIYCPLYRGYYLSPEKQTFNTYEESTFFQKLYCYFFFEFIEVIFRIILNAYKTKKVKKVMRGYAKSIIDQSQIENNYHLYINDFNFDLYIFKKSFFKSIYKFNEENKSFLNNTKNNFYQYVINYPNVRYYDWDRKILNEKENEIADNIIQTIKLAEKEHVKKYGVSVFIVWIFYFLSFNNLIKGQKLISLLFRLINFIFTKIVSIFLSNTFKGSLLEKQEILSRQYIQNGYFIVLNFCTIQIFKLKDDYIDNTLNINEIYKNINKDVVNLNEKIIENNNY